MRRRLASIALGAAALAMLAYCAANLRFGTDITNFLPDGSSSDLAALSGRLTDSTLTRTVVVSIGAPELPTAVAAAKELATFLREHEEVAWVRSAFDETDLESLFAVYFPHRLGFLSDDPEAELPPRLTDAALGARAREIKRRLASPASGFFEPLLTADPLGAFETLVTRLREENAALRLVDGQLVTVDGRFAILLLGTRGSAFDSGAQSRFLDDMAERFAAIDARLGGGLELERSAAGAFAVAAESGIKRDIRNIAACSFVGIALLFAFLVGSIRGFVLVSLPPMVGILVATTTGLLVFGSLDGITLAFGTSLMGIVIDYSNHVLLHHGLAHPNETAAQVVRRIRPSLVLGALTTVASFVGLLLTPFPAFRQISFFAIVGILAGLAASLWLLPPLLRHAPDVPDRARRSADRLERLFRRLQQVPVARLRVPLACTGLALLALPMLHWSDDLSRLTRFDPALVAEDQRVRERIAQYDTARFVVLMAPDVQTAVARNDALALRLEGAVEAGAVAGVRSLHALFRSEDLQQRNLDVLTADPGLYARLDAAFAAEGFRPGAFAPFAESLRDPAGPLAFDALRASPAADLLSPYLIDLGDRVAVVTYLRRLADAAAVRAAIGDLPNTHLLEQRTFVNEIYREFREASLEQIAVGGALVVLLLALRYRDWRPVLASFLPSVLVAVWVAAALATLGEPLNLFHVMSLIMVMGMGVDYGIFCVDSIGRHERMGVTLVSLLLSCLTTAFVFGTLVISSQPSLRAIGATTGIGVLLSFALAPAVVAASRFGRARGAS